MLKNLKKYAPTNVNEWATVVIGGVVILSLVAALVIAVYHIATGQYVHNPTI